MVAACFAWAKLLWAAGFDVVGIVVVAFAVGVNEAAAAVGGVAVVADVVAAAAVVAVAAVVDAQL